MTRSLWIPIALLAAACELRPKPSPNDVRIAAARGFTAQYAKSPLARWNVRGSAAGPDCDVLLVDTSIVMDDSMIEALHYGGGIYSVVDEAGVQRFSRRNTFRGVAYKDSTARLWQYGITAEEAATLKRCD